MSQITHDSHPAAAHGSHGGHDLQADLRKYMIVFGALIVGTIVTVLASYIHFGSTSINIAVALLIASVKVFLVGGYFMHLISEKKMIFAILGSTVFFVIGLMYLIIWSMEPTSHIHIPSVLH